MMRLGVRWAGVVVTTLLLAIGGTQVHADELSPTADDVPPPTPGVIEDVPAEPMPPTVEIRFEDAPTTTLRAGPASFSPRRVCTPKRRSCWRFNLEAGVSLMPDPDGVVGATPPAGFTSLDWSQHEYGIAPGGRLTVGYQLSQKDELEGRVAVLGFWDDSSRQTGSFGFTNVTGRSPVATATLESEAQLQSYEGMWWRDLCSSGGASIRIGAGLRHVHFEEAANVRNWVGLAPSSRLDGTAHNRLFAAQLGVSATFQPAPKWQFTLSAKAMVGLINHELIVDEDSILSGGVKQDIEEENGFGYGFELELHARYRCSSCLTITGGYTGLFLGEIVRGPDIFDFSQGATGAVQAIERTDSIFVHSLFLGIEWSY